MCVWPKPEGGGFGLKISRTAAPLCPRSPAWYVCYIGRRFDSRWCVKPNMLFSHAVGRLVEIQDEQERRLGRMETDREMLAIAADRARAIISFAEQQLALIEQQDQAYL